VILLVEDEELARYPLATILRNAGYGVMEAADGAEALCLLEGLDCDLVIADILMPNLNGYALAARIRENWPSIPIILMSGYVTQDAAHGVLNGAVEFLAKPIGPRDLISMVKRLVPRK
jgi:CheY-like chemotaxis protein